MESHHLSTLDPFSVISTDREKLMLISSRGIGTVASSSRQQIFTSLDSHAAIATWRTRRRLVLAAVAPGGSGTLPQPTWLPRAVCSAPHASPALIGPICHVLSLSQCLLLSRSRQFQPTCAIRATCCARSSQVRRRPQPWVRGADETTEPVTGNCTCCCAVADAAVASRERSPDRPTCSRGHPRRRGSLLRLDVWQLLRAIVTP